MIMSIEDLPPYFNRNVELDDGSVRNYRFFLNINRDLTGKWSCGYVKFGDEDTGEMVIPNLFTNSSDTIEEVAVRMAAKVKRFNNKDPHA